MKTLICLVVLLAAVAGDAAQAAGRYERVAVPAASLEGNLGGDSAERQVSVYLPASYATQPRRRYPVLYLLHGFTDNDAQWFGQSGKHFVHVPNAVEAAAAESREIIVVMPNALTRFGGSMYSNSVVVGDWETFVAKELVAFVDQRYRTLSRPSARGLAGHSMGGYGTLRVAMKKPGVFGAWYAMSPCCLAPPGEPDPRWFEKAAQIQSHEGIGAADFMTKAMLASAAAWSPNPKKPPLYIDLPVADGKPLPQIQAAWIANAPLAMLHQHMPALKSYRAIAFDAGDQDGWISTTTRQLHDSFESYSLAHDFEIYEGDHLNRIEMRLTNRVLPFFSRHLDKATP